MPRLTNTMFLERRRFLRRAWDDFRPVFSAVRVNQQWDVHRFYQVQAESTEVQLLVCRTELTSADPSLPQRASKTFVLIYQPFCFAFEYAQGDEILFHKAIQLQAEPSAVTGLVVDGRRSGDRAISVRAVARTEIDLRKLTQALLHLAEQLAAQQEADPDRSQSDAA